MFYAKARPHPFSTLGDLRGLTIGTSHGYLYGSVFQDTTVIARENQYLAIRRNAGMDLLVQRFGAELQRFKREPAYAELVARYADKSKTAP